jgi:hypothetical protein
MRVSEVRRGVVPGGRQFLGPVGVGWVVFEGRHSEVLSLGDDDFGRKPGNMHQSSILPIMFEELPRRHCKSRRRDSCRSSSIATRIAEFKG